MAYSKINSTILIVVVGMLRVIESLFLEESTF